jgi:16S rRNA (guanine527-N7)-methyltransferase
VAPVPDTTDDQTLLAALGIAQRVGVTGEVDLVAAVAHARAFVRCLEELPPGAEVVDLGSGGGLPGIVIAHDRPDVRVTLVERRRSRADLLVRMAGRIMRADSSDRDRVRVVGDDAERVMTPPGGFDAATARSFGPPEATLRAAVHLVRSGGLVVVSDPPTDTQGRWTPELLAQCGVEFEPVLDQATRISRFRVLPDVSRETSPH